MTLSPPELFPISSRIREELKHPLGQLIVDEKINAATLSPFFEIRSNILVCVGDRTTERVHDLGFSPNLEIVDSVEKRVARDYPRLFEQSRIVLTTENPPGTISRKTLNTLYESLVLVSKPPQRKVRIEVIGEEDLLVLPVVAFFPEPTIVFYGQPNVGMVAVSTTVGREPSKMTLREMGILSLM